MHYILDALVIFIAVILADLVLDRVHRAARATRRRQQRRAKREREAARPGGAEVGQ